MIKLDEAITELFDDVNPSQINLKSFDIKEELNPKIWCEGLIKPEIREALLLIAKDFAETVKIENLPITDVVVVGSIASYNWSKYSDIDLHLLVDFKKIKKVKDDEVLKDYFNSKKNDWNNKHEDLRVEGFPVELYIQSINEDNATDGMYSLTQDYWIKTPETKELQLNKVLIKQHAANLINRIEKMQDAFEKCRSKRKLKLLNMLVTKLYETICQDRKDGLNIKGEGSTENIVFKVLRRTGHLKQLRDLKNEIYDKLNSI